MKKEFELLYDVYPVLKCINQEYDGVLKDRITIKKMEAGAYMNSVNETCQGVLFVLKGEVKIKRLTEDGGEMNLYNLLPGDLCHEAFQCILHCATLHIEGEAMQDSLTAIIPVDVVRTYCLEDAEFVTYMYEDLYKKFNQVICAKEEKVLESLDTRLYKYFLRQNASHIYKTHKEIAFEIDASRESVSRKLKQYEKKGILTMERGCIHLQADILELLNQSGSKK